MTAYDEDGYLHGYDGHDAYLNQRLIADDAWAHRADDMRTQTKEDDA